MRKWNSHNPFVRASSIYLIRGSLKSQRDLYLSIVPAATWTPSSGLPCPGQCFSLTYFTFISSSFTVGA